MFTSRGRPKGPQLKLPAPHPASSRTTPLMLRRAPLARPEPDYEVVEFPSDQYVNAKMQPPPPPAKPAIESGASCGLCGGGGARVRCAECGSRALCASCDEMYHRHPKRRHHQRQALSPTAIAPREERPPLPPKATPPVPPPRRHKLSGDRASASPRPPSADPQRRATISSLNATAPRGFTLTNQHQPMMQLSQPPVTRVRLGQPAHLGSMPYLPTAHQVMPQPVTHAPPAGLMGAGAQWSRPRGPLPAPNLPQNPGWHNDAWEAQGVDSQPSWGRPLRRGASVLELGGPGCGGCSGCGHCAQGPWRYGSCASLEPRWAGWPPPPPCCAPHPHHAPHTPQPYRRGESRAVSRAASRHGSRAASPANSVRSRMSRRTKPRSPSPPLSSSDADSESESESDHRGSHRKEIDGLGQERQLVRQRSRKDSLRQETVNMKVDRGLVRRNSNTRREPNNIRQESNVRQEETQARTEQNDVRQDEEEDSLGPPPPPPSVTWQCEFCTFVNEPGVRVCAVCCRTPTAVPKPVEAQVVSAIERVNLNERVSPAKSIKREDSVKKSASNKPVKERTSTGCGPSPPREQLRASRTSLNETEQAVRNRTNSSSGPSPIRETKHNIAVGSSLPSTTSWPNREPKKEESSRHSVSVGPSPPRDVNARRDSSSSAVFLRKSAGTTPPREGASEGQRAVARRSVSNTGTSPPPQNISTQTYEDPKLLERVSPRSRSRRRLHGDSRRERSHSRHSLSSDTRESVRSVRTEGRWEWRESREGREGRDSSPGGDWSGSERRRSSRMSRRASHLDLRRARAPRTAYYGSEAPSPEPLAANRAMSMEALASLGSRRETERGLELARLMGDAERLGFSAAEVRAALAQNPAAPLAWLRERWPSLCAAVRAAALRLSPTSPVSETDARGALARHRGAMWPAVTDCVEKYRKQAEVGEEIRLRGHVWGAPAGADDDAAPPAARLHRNRAEDSSDEYEVTAAKDRDDWMFSLLETSPSTLAYEESFEVREPSPLVYSNQIYKSAQASQNPINNEEHNIAQKLKSLLAQAGIPSIDENLLLQGLLNASGSKTSSASNNDQLVLQNKDNVLDLAQSENDFINAYNALTRLSPLPAVQPQIDSAASVKTEVTKESKNYNQETPNASNNTNEQKALNNFALPEERNSISMDVAGYSFNSNHQRFQEQQRSFIVQKTKFSTNTASNNALISQSTGSQFELNNNNSEIYEDKTNNLNDIVDNTQRIIQQMKDEINSDINSLDDANLSESKSDRSAEETESSGGHESSYTNSEGDTDDITSEESRASSNHNNNRKPQDIDSQFVQKNRTSSEENEQFEEALDHIDDENDYKKSNFEVLNSIARSLQEEHTISFELQRPATVDKVQRDEDANNFSVVESFEEIYQELNLSANIIKAKLQESNSDQSKVNETNVSNGFQLRDDLIKTYLVNKHELIKLFFEAEPPQEIVYKENKPKILNASLDFNEDTKQGNVNSTINDQDISPLENASNSESFEFIDATLDGDDDQTTKDNTNIDTPNKLTNGQLDTIMTRPENIPESIPPAQIVASPPKSSIPKPIKWFQNTKQSIQRNTKVIASKVPVRRNSLKQHAPAPPKMHFGNVQSGHVKQLQSRLFTKPKITFSPKALPPTTTIEIKPSTSTMSKKGPAPAPPTNHGSHVILPSPTKEKKKPYFRESCRTEDEWTESDSDDSQSRPVPANNDEEYLAPRSPPPPLTLRRVSGQLIDLANVRLPEGSPERQARMLLAEGATETWDQARLAVELVARGAEPPSALLAALECIDLNSALAYLHQDCELCTARLPEHEMVSMLRCTHRCCRECARHYFTVQITERSIADCVCPFCKHPELEGLGDDEWLEYFAHLDILLKALVDDAVHELFQRKLRDRTLARDPNFRWCVECSSGFFVHPKHKKLRCPECRSVSCASCRKPWSSNHEGLSCEQFAKWLEDNDPEVSVAAVQQHLRENGLECPRCRFKYSLSRGGCMHFTCTQCKYEFCYGCGKPFTMGARCGLSDYCAKLGLHAHHPRNCLFYLRDKEPHELQTLLQMNNVSYETEPAKGSSGRCPVPLQRETPAGLVDGQCGAEVPPKHAGLCKNHYLEYLSRRVRSSEVDPLPILGVDDLETLVRRAALRPPPRPYGTLEGLYKRALVELVKEKIPLD